MTKLVRRDVHHELYKRVRALVAKSPGKRPKVYRDEHGDHFMINECACCITIRWYFPDEGAFGHIVSNTPYRNMDKDYEVANGITRSFFKEHRLRLPAPERPFNFPSKARAIQCLHLIHAALNYRRRVLREPLPEWAKEAAGAGWLPPKGWRP